MQDKALLPAAAEGLNVLVDDLRGADSRMPAISCPGTRPSRLDGSGDPSIMKSGPPLQLEARSRYLARHGEKLSTFEITLRRAARGVQALSSARWRACRCRPLHEFHHHRLGATIDEVEYADAEVDFFDDLVKGVSARARSWTR
jgi:hypothetical protein